jgi:hypothetical protein
MGLKNGRMLRTAIFCAVITGFLCINHSDYYSVSLQITLSRAFKLAASRSNNSRFLLEKDIRVVNITVFFCRRRTGTAV